MFNQRLIERRAPLSSQPAPMSEKEFSKTALTKNKHSAIGIMEARGFPNLRTEAFPLCRCLDRGYGSL